MQEELGRGGTAVVYRAVDTVSGRELALKQLSAPSDSRRHAEHAAALEREYHALMQLAHPRIIEVYDFGDDEHGRFYTMELLDGGDLREQGVLPWREACALFYDVCSSLALLHSRQLVHRDVSPRNIRKKRDGSAKLIDFGALVTLGTSAQVVGTPPFVAPEVLHRSTLDARTDLFSLGATLYFALTGRLAYRARTFSELHQAWARRPMPPSRIVPEIPAALDALVLALVSLDPAARPRTAFEVMQKLAALAGLEHNEAPDVSQAYLSTPTLVGRDDALARVRAQTERSLTGRGGALMIRGAEGVGRTRLLDACALDAKLAGSVVLRVNAGSPDDAPLTLGEALATQLMEALPDAAFASAAEHEATSTLFEPLAARADNDAKSRPRPVLKPLAGHAGDRSAIQSALTGWLLQVAKSHSLVVLVDDLHRAEQASLSLLAALGLTSERRRLSIVSTAPSAPRARSGAFAVLERESAQLELQPLDRAQTESLLGSVFGDVPKLALVSERLYAAAGGNPRETLELVRLLIARDLVRYQGGQWVLPGQLDVATLPGSAIEACKQQRDALPVLARQLAQRLALSSHPSLSRAEIGVALHDVPAAQVDAALTQLLAARVLRADGHVFTLARREWQEVLLEQLDDDARAAHHRALAQVLGEHEDHGIERVHHLLSGALTEVGLDLLVALLLKTTADSHGVLTRTKLRAELVASILDGALTLAEGAARKARDVHEIRRSLFAISVATDEAHYQRTAPRLFAQLRHDAGLDLYEAMSDVPPSERLKRALGQAAQRYAVTPEVERVYAPEQAIRGLVHYVVISIAYGSRAQDHALISALPGVLEPLAPLSPLVHAVWQNAIATRETLVDSQPERAHARWQKVLQALANVSRTDVSWIDSLRNAIQYGMGLIEARCGFASAEARAKALDDDPMQQVSAMSLRRIACLHRGNAVGAERYRKQAEALALRANVRQMFTSTLSAELIAYALASDLTGLREVLDAIRPLAARFPGWSGYLHLAEGYFEQTRGKLEDARDAFERGLLVSQPSAGDPTRTTGAWTRLESAHVELLLALGETEKSHERGVAALECCARHGLGLGAFPVGRALALAEAKLGHWAAASQRLDEVARGLNQYDVRGLELGATYEARTRVAIWSGDLASIERYARLTAEEYRYGQGSALGARYERLMDEARANGATMLPELTEFDARLMTSQGMSRSLHSASSGTLDPVSSEETGS